MNIKKLVSGVMATFLSLGLATGTALAAGSATAQPSVVNSDEYTITEVTSAPSFSTIQAQTPKVAAAIVATNEASSSSDVTETLFSQLEAMINDSSLPESVKTSAQKVLQELQANNEEALTNFFDLDKTSENVKKVDGKYEVTLTVPSITANTTDIVVLHYSVDNQEWELIEPKSVDLANKQIVVDFDNLSPVMVLAKTGTGSGLSNMSNSTSSTATSSTSTTTSPQTSVDSNWGIYAAVAVVLLAAGVAVLAVRKKNGNHA